MLRAPLGFVPLEDSLHCAAALDLPSPRHSHHNQPRGLGYVGRRRLRPPWAALRGLGPPCSDMLRAPLGFVPLHRANKVTHSIRSTTSIIQMGPGIGAPRSQVRADSPGPVYISHPPPPTPTKEQLRTKPCYANWSSPSIVTVIVSRTVVRDKQRTSVLTDPRHCPTS